MKDKIFIGVNSIKKNKSISLKSVEQKQVSTPEPQKIQKTNSLVNNNTDSLENSASLLASILPMIILLFLTFIFIIALLNFIRGFY